MTETITAPESVEVPTEPAALTTVDLAREVLAVWTSDRGVPMPTGGVERDGVVVFTGENDRTYQVSGQCVAESSSDPDTVQEASRWIR